jgi:hypothetical protein
MYNTCYTFIQVLGFVYEKFMLNYDTCNLSSKFFMLSQYDVIRDYLFPITTVAKVKKDKIILFNDSHSFLLLYENVYENV